MIAAGWIALARAIGADPRVVRRQGRRRLVYEEVVGLPPLVGMIGEVIQLLERCGSEETRQAGNR